MSLSPKTHNELLSGFAAPLVLQLGEGEVSARRLALLAAVAETGSISGAAKRIGMTYKAAWDAVEAMNNLAGQALVSSQHGGQGGGGARLTPLGERIVRTQRRLGEALDAVLEQFRSEDGGLENLSILRSLHMKTSARNALRGTVREVRHGAVNSEVTLHLQGDDYLNVIVTRESAETMGLTPGKPVWALIKASWIILAAPDECLNVVRAQPAVRPHHASSGRRGERRSGAGAGRGQHPGCHRHRGQPGYLGLQSRRACLRSDQVQPHHPGRGRLIHPAGADSFAPVA
ncbi:MAG: TOBE domain-containing protein [Pseudomonadota bacterium]